MQSVIGRAWRYQRGNQKPYIEYNLVIRFRLMMFKDTFNIFNFLVILWRSVLLVEETGVPANYHIMFYRVHLAWAGFELITLVVNLVIIQCFTVYKMSISFLLLFSATLAFGVYIIFFQIMCTLRSSSQPIHEHTVTMEMMQV